MIGFDISEEPSWSRVCAGGWQGTVGWTCVCGFVSSVGPTVLDFFSWLETNFRAVSKVEKSPSVFQ